MADKAPYDIAALKAGGLMKQNEPDLFHVCLRVVGGRMEAAQLEALAELARKYARGHIHLTTRQGVGIPYVHLEDIEGLREELAVVGLEFGACGPRARTITACHGESCSHGLIDSQALAQKIEESVSGRSDLPHGFNVGIAGCPNACIRPQENDLGIMGTACKIFHQELCNRCGLCVLACPIPDTLEMKDARLLYREETCVLCGACCAACPTDAWEQVGTGYVLFVGGKMGKRPRIGDRLLIEIRDEEHLLQIVDETIEWYATHGEPGERFGETLDRVGTDALVGHLLSLTLAPAKVKKSPDTVIE